MKEKEIFLKKMEEETSLNKSDVDYLFINEIGFPMGWNHVSIFDQLHEPALKKDVFEQLRQSYVYLASFFFAMDRIIDKQSNNSDDLLLSTYIFDIAKSKIIDIYPVDKKTKINGFFLEMLLVNREAIKMEKKFHLSPMEESLYEEIDNMSGRAVLFVFIYKAICLYKNIEISKRLIEIVKVFLFYMQLGDDLGDWREDFKNNSWSSFLRSCFKNIGYIPNSENEIEEYVYLSGIYEERAEFIINGLSDTVDKLKSLNDANVEFLTFFIQKQIERISFVMGNFKQVKEGGSACDFKFQTN